MESADNLIRIQKEKIALSPKKFRGTFIVDGAPKSDITEGKSEDTTDGALDKVSEATDPRGTTLDVPASDIPPIPAGPSVTSVQQKSKKAATIGQKPSGSGSGSKERTALVGTLLEEFLRDASNIFVEADDWKTRPESIGELLCASEDEYHILKCLREHSAQTTHKIFDDATRSIAKKLMKLEKTTKH